MWKDIVGYEGYYQINPNGDIRSLNRLVKNNGTMVKRKGTLLKHCINNSGYHTVKLHKEGKTKLFFVHKCVAEAFIDNPFNLREVNHIDHNKDNNNMENLEWCTRKENIHKMLEFYHLHRQIKYCKKCGKPLSNDNNSKLCLNCYNKSKLRGKSNRKVERPSKESLIIEIQHRSICAIGRKYGVSDNAIRKWCKYYDIDYKSIRKNA